MTAVQDALIDGDTNPTVIFAVNATVDARYAALANQVSTVAVYDSLLTQDVHEIALGETQSCYVDNDVSKTMYCWGIVGLVTTAMEIAAAQAQSFQMLSLMTTY